MISPFALLAFCLICALPAVAGDSPQPDASHVPATREIRVKWKCPLVPSYDKGDIAKDNVVIGLGDKASDFSEFRALLTQLEDASHLSKDYWDCLDRFVVDLKYSSIPTPDETLARVQSEVAAYGARAHKRGALPLLPVEKLSEHFPSPDALKKFYENEDWKLSSCSSYSGNLDPYLLSAQYVKDALPKAIRWFHSDKPKILDKCIQNVARLYVEGLLKLWPDEEVCKKSLDVHIQTGCQEHREFVQNSLEALKRIPELKKFLAVKDSGGTIAKCGGDAEKTRETLGSIAALGLALNESAHCVKLKAGEKTEVGGKGASYARLSGLRGKYDLDRLPDSQGHPQFRILIRPKFNVTPAAADDTIQNYYLQKTQDCFNKYKDYFKGPNGEGLGFQFESPGAQGSTAEISIEHGLARENSAQWSANIDCPVQLHEIMHTLGLVDEYQETASGVTVDADGNIKKEANNATLPEFDCRAIGPPDSLMSNQWSALEALEPRREATYCECIPSVSGGFPPGGGFGAGMGMPIPSPSAKPEVDEKEKAKIEAELKEETRKCQLKLSSIGPAGKSCPAGTYQGVRALSMKAWSNSSDQRADFERYANSGAGLIRTLEVRSLPGRKSLFYPAQFRALVHPDCPADNETYYRCAKDAYKTSRGSYGQDRCTANLPEECRKGGAEWLR
ncbi:hypothetical protein WDW86_11175 [Bdellovibrionota bacterium FG-2]